MTAVRRRREPFAQLFPLAPLILAAVCLALAPATAAAAMAIPTVAGVPVDFLLFAAILAGIALFHHHTLGIAVGGLAVILLYKLGVTGFREGAGLEGLGRHLVHEWVTLANLLGLLLGFALLSKHFEDSNVPAMLPKLLPDDWKGAFVLLAMIWVISSFLDNIAAALIGGAVAHTVFRGKVHIGFLAAIVAASNAGGAFSVVGDTTTTMMWIAGVHPLSVLEAIVASLVALAIFGIPAARQQQAHSPIVRDPPAGIAVDWARVFIVAFILIAAIVVNVTMNTHYSELADRFPFLGLTVWVVLIVCVPLRRPDWSLLPGAFKGTVFLLSLVLCASLMPVERLPAASWQTAMGLGFVSAVFDNIPLTALALNQGGYDWGFLAFAVGFGGSMIWFGSSAGVALTNMYPDGKNVFAWLKSGWHVTLAYVVAFLVMLALVQWHPDPPLRGQGAAPAPAGAKP
jgi:Na+/H+ antiporter NhaD/arsenite permease-like protein